MRGDGLYRQPGSPYWYTKLRINGRWREISTKKRKYGEAKSERKKLIQDQDEGRLPEGQLAGWAFERVAHQYLQAASIRLRPSSLKKERFFLVRPIREFGSLHCEKITAASIRQLQMNMKEGGCQNSYINLVTGATARVLRFSKTWRRIQDDVNRLPERAMPIARVLTVEEKARLFGVAARNPDWMVAYTAALIAVSTTTRACDLRALRWSDVDLFERTVSVPDSKSDAGIRRIPLNDDAFASFRILHDRAIKLGIADPTSCVFPACEHRRIDPTTPQKSWRTAWRSLTKKAGLKGLRFHDLRHQCVTELAERGAPDQTIMAIAGHVSRRMLEHYSHIRLEARREAVNSLTSVLPGGVSETTRLRPN